MNWFVWRQHRKQFLIFGILFIALAALVIPTGNHYWHVYQQALVSCAQNPTLPSCSDLAGSVFVGNWGVLYRIIVLATFALPLLVGMFIGTPLLAREYEEGTNKLAWTQSVSRRTWLTARLGLALVFAAFYGLALSLLVTWWLHTSNVINQDRFIQGHFEVQGLMPIVYTTFFTAVGFMAGAWFRKTLLALAVTIGMFILCLASFAQLIRPHYESPVIVTASMTINALDAKIPQGAWVISRGFVDQHGTFSDHQFDLPQWPQRCQALALQAPTSSITSKAVSGENPIDDCLTAAGYRQMAKYQPAYRYWDFQRIEAGIYLGMTALAIGATYLLVLKRDA